MMSSGVHSRPPSSSGSMASTTDRSTRTSMAGAVASMMLADGRPGDVERHLRANRAARRRRRRAGSTTVPRGATRRTSVPVGDAEPVEVERVDVGGRRSPASGASDGDCAVPTARSYSLRVTTSR